MNVLEKYRASIAKKVRDLRRDRRWTQTELAERLGLSQSRLSEIERGDGSFTAEQFLVILQLFNISASQFSDARSSDENALQNALARLGALHLQESEDTLPSEQLRKVNDAVREALITASPRLLTALGPVLACNAKLISLSSLLKVYSALEGIGLERRLCWLAENVRDAIDQERDQRLPTPWRSLYQQASVTLSAFLDSTRRGVPDAKDIEPDFLDRSIGAKTRADLERSASRISRDWGIITALQPEDFARALKAARVAD